MNGSQSQVGEADFLIYLGKIYVLHSSGASWTGANARFFYTIPSGWSQSEIRLFFIQYAGWGPEVEPGFGENIRQASRLDI